MHTAGGRAASREIPTDVQTYFPSFPDFPHIYFLLDLLQLLLLPLLLSRSAHGHAVRRKNPLPLRTARVLTIKIQ